MLLLFSRYFFAGVILLTLSYAYLTYYMPSVFAEPDGCGGCTGVGDPTNEGGDTTFTVDTWGTFGDIDVTGEGDVNSPAIGIDDLGESAGKSLATPPDPSSLSFCAGPGTSAISFTPSVGSALYSIFRTDISGPQTGAGLFGMYFNNQDLSEPRLTRIDPQIKFDWGVQSPDQKIETGSFSVKWIGKIKAKSGGTYTFFAQATNGVRLYIDDNRVISDWSTTKGKVIERSGKVDLLENSWHNIRLEYFSDIDPSSVELLWQGPGVAKETVPGLNLFPSFSNNIPTPVLAKANIDDPNSFNSKEIPGLFAKFYDDQSFKGTPNLGKRVDTIDFNWGLDSPDPAIGAGSYGVKFLGKLNTKESGDYTFIVTGNGDVSLTLDSQVITKGTLTEKSPEKTGIIKGLGQNSSLDIGLKYQYSKGNGFIKLSWKTPNGTEEVIPVSQLSATTKFQPFILTQGLLTKYFDNMKLNALPVTKVSSEINFTSGSSPDPVISPTTFSIRWLGKIRAPETGNYTFYTRSKDGVSVVLQRQQIIKAWADQKSIRLEKSKPVALEAGKTYNIMVNYYNNSGDPYMKLTWQRPSQNTEEDIPPDRFYYGKILSPPVSTIDETAQNNTLYLYQISAIGSGAAVPSNWTYNLSGSCTSPVITQAQASCNQTDAAPQVILNWTPVGGTAEYRVYRSDRPLTPIASVPDPATTFLDNQVLADTAYSYAVTSYNPAGGESPIVSWTPITNQAGGTKTPGCSSPPGLTPPPPPRSSGCQIDKTNPRAQGLISTPDLNNPLKGSYGAKFGNPSGACIINTQQAAIPLYKIPNFAELKSVFYDQSKGTKNALDNKFPKTFIADGIHAANPNTSITIDKQNPVSGSGVQIFFVDGSLNLNRNIIYHTNDPLGGLVFVVKGDINIDSSVTQIDAVLISEGSICTASINGSCALSYVTAEPLIINGSLISLNPASIIQFKRTLNNLSAPAEKINAQAKYYIILRNLFTQTVSYTTEE